MKPLRRLIWIVALLAAAMPRAGAQQRPRLVVAVVIDQLRTDYLDFLRPLMGPGGFERLRRGGLYMKDVEFDPLRLDFPTAAAMLMTGAPPSENGVAGAETWDQTALRTAPTLSDPSTLGINTAQALSPAKLLLSTLSDELAIDGIGLGEIQAVAADAQTAVALAGHAATAATWLNTADGRWASSAYYKALPQAAAARNQRRPLASRIDTMQWKPLLKLEQYPALPDQKKRYEFRHTFPSRNKNVYELFALSPRGNAEVTDLAVDILQNLKMGSRGGAIDFLALGLTAAPFPAVKDGDYRLELQDTYLRLDRDLARLLAAIDKGPGLDNCLLLLCGTGYYDDAVAVDPKYRIPTGDFSTKRAQALLEGFLQAKYGAGNYVATWAGGGLHFNPKTFETKGISAEEAAAAAKPFLAKMSGVRAVYTLSDILSPGDDYARALRLSTVPATAPALTLELQPGWNLVEDHLYPVRTTPVRRGNPATPALLYSPVCGVGAGKEMLSPVEATALAPTLAALLHIRTPNGAASRPIPMP